MAGERVLGALAKLTGTIITLSIRSSAYLSACNKSALTGPVFRDLNWWLSPISVQEF